jgi:hypothetical protein
MGSLNGRGKGGSLVSKALSFVSKNPDKVKGVIAKAGGFVNKKTHGKYSRHIMTAQTKASQAIDKTSRNNGRGRNNGYGGNNFS